MLDYVLVETVNGHLQATATDGHRLARERGVCEGEGALHPVLLNAEALKVVLGFLPDNAKRIKFGTTERDFWFNIEGFILGIVTYEKDNFPTGVVKNIEHPCSHSFACNKDELIQTVKKVSATNEDGTTFFRTEGTTLYLTAKSSLEDIRGSRALNIAEPDGGDLHICLNGNYILDALKTVPTSRVKILYSAEKSLVKIEHPSGEHIIMTMRHEHEQKV